MRSVSKEGLYLRLVDVCITQIQAESNKKKKDTHHFIRGRGVVHLLPFCGQLLGTRLPKSTNYYANKTTQIATQI